MFVFSAPDLCFVVSPYDVVGDCLVVLTYTFLLCLFRSLSNLSLHSNKQSILQPASIGPYFFQSSFDSSNRKVMCALRLWVGNLPPDTTRDELRAFLESFQIPVASLFMPQKAVLEVSKNYAFVDVADQGAYDWALRELTGELLRGCRVKVNVAIDKQANHPDQPHYHNSSNTYAVSDPVSRINSTHDSASCAGQTNAPFFSNNPAIGSDVYSNRLVGYPIEYFQRLNFNSGAYSGQKQTEFTGYGFNPTFDPATSTTPRPACPPAPRSYNSRAAALHLVTRDNDDHSSHIISTSANGSEQFGPALASPAPSASRKTIPDTVYWDDPAAQCRLCVGGLPVFAPENLVQAFIYKTFGKYNVHFISELMPSSKIQYEKNGSNYCVFVDMNSDEERQTAKVELDGTWMGWGHLRVNLVKARRNPCEG